jgi:hypothetical protein
MNLSKDLGHLGVYCILTMDKQQVRTQLMEDFKNLRWNEGFFLYVIVSSVSPLPLGRHGGGSVSVRRRLILLLWALAT